MKKPTFGLFVTGTSTEVGKTFVASLIAASARQQGLRVGVYKPTASGCEEINGQLVSDDAVQLWQAAGEPMSLDAVCPQRFKAALAPHLAARAEHRTVDPILLREGISQWHEQCDLMIVEGAGGLMSPISDDDFVADLAADLGYPLIVVAPNELGTINQTLQTLIAAETYSAGLHVAGIFLNDLHDSAGHDSPDESLNSNATEIQRLAIPPLLEHIQFSQRELANRIDWMTLAQTSR